MASRKICGIYEIVNKANGNRYIGSSRNVKVRWSQHRAMLKEGRHHSPPLQKAWNKYGADAFEFRVIAECDKAETIDLEQAHMDRLEPEYNVAKAAGYQTFLGLKHRPETIAKMSEAHKGNTRTKGMKRCRTAVEATAEAHRGMKRSDETRAKISAAMTGKKRAPYSEETRRKLSEALKKRPPNPERVAKMAATKRGSTLSEAHKKAIGEASRRAWARRKAAGQ